MDKLLWHLLYPISREYNRLFHEMIVRVASVSVSYLPFLVAFRFIVTFIFILTWAYTHFIFHTRTSSTVHIQYEIHIPEGSNQRNIRRNINEKYGTGLILKCNFEGV